MAHTLHENGTAGGYRAHICGFWRPVHCLSATAVSLGNSRDGCTTLENLRSTIQGHRDGHTTTHSPQSQATDRLLNKSCGAFWGGASVSALLAGLALSLSIAPAPAAAHPLPPRSQTASTAFVQQPACRPLCPWMADRPLSQGRSANKERTPLPRAGWSGDHSIAGVVPTGVSRWMFRCLWHTSQGSRLVL